MMSSKEIIFFILVFVMMLVSAYTTFVAGPKLKLGPTPALLIFTLLTVIFLYFIYKLTNVCSNQDGFHFEVTPAKLCDGGMYMTQTGPNHGMCKKMWMTNAGRQELGHYNCLNGGCDNQGLYNGRPLHMERTPMSDALWQNQMCSPPILSEGYTASPTLSCHPIKKSNPDYTQITGSQLIDTWGPWTPQQLTIETVHGQTTNYDYRYGMDDSQCTNLKKQYEKNKGLNSI